MSLRDASQLLEELGVKRSYVAVHNWVHKADLQPISTVSADQLAVDEESGPRQRRQLLAVRCRRSRNERNIAVQAVSNDNETDDAMVSRRAASTIPTRSRRISRR